MKIPIQAIPTYKGKETTHSDMADNKDIRAAIFSAMPEAINQTKEFSKYFKRNSVRETCKLIFDFLKNELNYVADGETQLIKLPSALLHTKVGDCKSYSILTAAILYNLGIPCHFVLVSFNSDPTPSHIFVETSDGCIIDAVWGIFDDEKKPTYRYEVSINGKMKVKSISGVGQTYLSGCGCGCGCNSCKMTGIGATRPNSKAEVNSFCENKYKTKFSQGTCKAYWNAINWAETKKDDVSKVAFFAGRNLFLVAIKANLDGFGTKLSKMNFSNLSNLWLKVGGNPTNLQDAIKIGSQKPSKKLGLLGSLAKKSKKVNGISGGIYDENAVGNTIIATATAAGTAINPGGGTAAGASFGAVLKAMLPMIMEALNMLLPSESSDVIVAPVLSDSEKSELNNSGSRNVQSSGGQTAWYQDINWTFVAIGAGLAYYLYTKRK